MALLHNFRIAGILYAFFALLISTSAEAVFTNTNSVPTTSGGIARLVGVTSVNPATGTASVVIDARDRFGNPLRLVKTGTANPLKLRTYVQTCLRNPLVCAAAAGITSGLLYYGYTVIDGNPVIETIGGTYPECVLIPVPYGDGVVSALGPIPCTTAPAWNGTVHVYSLSPLPDNGFLAQTTTSEIYYFIDESQGLRGIVYDHLFTQEQTIEPTVEPITDETLQNIIMSDPTYLQVEEGVYPDIWEPVDVSADYATEQEILNQTEIQPNTEEAIQTDPQSEYEEMIDMAMVPEQTIDIEGYFDWGVGWLPKTCPPSQDLATIHGQTFTFQYDTLCGILIDYVSPLVRVMAIFSFLVIVIGGLRV